MYTNVLTGPCYGVRDAELSEVIVSIYGFAIGRAMRSVNPRGNTRNRLEWVGMSSMNFCGFGNGLLRESNESYDSTSPPF